MHNRVIVIGDIHGCLEEFDDLLRGLSFKAGADRLVLCGDLIDRGPDSLGVIRRARELVAESVLGNHEEKHLRFARHEAKKATDPKYRNPMQPFDETRLREHKSYTVADFQYIEAMKPFIRFGNFLVVHAGFESGIPIEKQSVNSIIRVRYLRPDGKNATKDNPFDVPKDAVRWPLLWKGPEDVIYGHAVYSLSTPQIDNRREFNCTCYGIDTGCVFGGYLTALVVINPDTPSQTITYPVAVRAKRQYHPLRKNPVVENGVVA